eukprot:4435176-Pleurochrysis_carterae.AAC.1
MLALLLSAQLIAHALPFVCSRSVVRPAGPVVLHSGSVVLHSCFDEFAPALTLSDLFFHKALFAPSFVSSTHRLPLRTLSLEHA